MTYSKIESKIYRKAEDTIFKVFESYAYNEIITDGKSCIFEESKKAVCEELTDEIFPVRILNRTKCGKIFAGLYGEKSITADAEILSCLISSLIALGIKEFKVTLSNLNKDDDKTEALFDLLTVYGISDYIDIDFNYRPEKRALSFAFKCEIDNAVIFKGGHCPDKPDIVYAVFNTENITNLLMTDRIREITPLPTALVASSSPSDSFKVSFGLRAQGLNIETYLKNTSMAEAVEYAEALGVTVIIWVDGDKIIMKNLKTGEMSETTFDKLCKKAAE